MHSAVLSTTGLRLTSFPDRHDEERGQLAVYRLIFCIIYDSAQLATHGVAEGEACMDVLVTSTDKPRPEGLQISTSIDPFFDPFPKSVPCFTIDNID